MPSVAEAVTSPIRVVWGGRGGLGEAGHQGQAGGKV
jgi:hypothetical protein